MEQYKSQQGWVGLLYIKNGLWVGQIILIVGATLLGAPIHVIMDQLFKAENRSTRVNMAFMLGL